MSQDLFAALNVNKFAELLYMLEHRVNVMFENRHEYPIGPQHDGQPDEGETYIHEPLRHTYYATAKILIHTLRDLRKAV